MNDLDALFDAHMALGLALDYPGSDWPQRLEAIESAQLPASVMHHLDEFVRIAKQWGHTKLQEHYVATFDNKRKCSLYVTYFNL
ncbi:MAG: hypothetical protein Q4Q03_08640, partial [Bowdeniella nasicola]|nr:hypothetical protein [Bowdeniella nasicola]